VHGEAAFGEGQAEGLVAFRSDLNTEAAPDAFARIEYHVAMTLKPAGRRPLGIAEHPGSRPIFGGETAQFTGNRRVAVAVETTFRLFAHLDGVTGTL